jgi:hypothetical protein
MTPTYSTSTRHECQRMNSSTNTSSGLRLPFAENHICSRSSAQSNALQCGGTLYFYFFVTTMFSFLFWLLVCSMINDLNTSDLHLVHISKVLGDDIVPKNEDYNVYGNASAPMSYSGSISAGGSATAATPSQ